MVSSMCNFFPQTNCVTFSHQCRKNVIISAVAKYQTVIIQKPVPFFQVVYKKHTLTLDDLSTLADQNWLNDQVTICNTSKYISCGSGNRTLNKTFMFMLNVTGVCFLFCFFVFTLGHEHVWRINNGICSSGGNPIPCK